MDLTLSVSVVLPLCIYIGIGLWAGRLGYLNPAAGKEMNKVVFKMLFPLLMFDNILNAGQQLREGDLSVVPFIALLVLVEFLLLLAIVPFFIKSRPRQGSFIQGCFRSNSVLFALPVVTTLCGEENTGIASVCLAVVVPLYNILSVILLESKRGGKVSVRGILKGIITNPLILGTIAGFLFLMTGLEFPALLSKPLKTLTSLVTPVSLIILGASLKFDGIRSDLGQLCWVSLVKLLIIPLVTVLAARLFGYSGIALTSVFALSCVPTAVSSYTMAEQMGADGPFAGEIVAFTTVLSMLTVFLWVTALSFLGLI